MLETLKKYFEINLDNYKNINFSLEINKVILGAYIVMVIGIIYLSVFRKNTRLMVMQLTRHGAKNEDSAKTLKELRLADSRGVKKLLAKNNLLTKTVARVGAQQYDYETYVAMSKKERKAAEKIDFDTARFYIKEEETNRAGFIIERYDVTVTKTVLSCLLVAIICGILIVCMPSILDTVDGWLTKTQTTNTK